MTKAYTRLAASLGVAAAVAVAAVPVAQARHGADDPVPHERAHHRHHHHHRAADARHGHDDPANHDRGDDHGRDG
jgi:hypothetical protein